MRQLYRRTELFSALFLFLAVVAFVALGSGVAAADGAIDDVEIVNVTDGDGDGNMSNFDVRIDADTRVSEFGLGAVPGEPMFNVTVGNEDELEAVNRTASGTFNVSLVGIDMANRSGSLSLTVELVDADSFEDDGRDLWEQSVAYEPPSHDFSERELARRGIESLSPSYAEYETRFFNADFWRGSSAENVRRAAAAANPVPTTKRGAAVDALSQVAGGPATTAWTAVETGVWSGIAFIEWKMSKLLESTNAYGDGTYNRFRSKLGQLTQNTRNIRQSETKSEIRDYIDNREELLREMYDTEQDYRYNVYDTVTDDDGNPAYVEFFDANRDDYELFKSEFNEFEKHLIADYYWTQTYLNPGAVEYANLTDAVHAPPTLSPEPNVTSVEVPESAAVGETIEVTATVRNDGVDAPFQSIAMSFPDAADADSVEIANTEFENQGYTMLATPGETVGSAYGTSNVSLSYPLAEVGGRWSQDTEKSMTVAVTPQTSGEFAVDVKSVAQDGGWDADPEIGSSEPTDQQSESVHRYTVSVEDPDDTDDGTDPSNSPPSATFDYRPDEPTTSDQITFDADASRDSDGSITEYQWDFDGDGRVEATRVDPTMEHGYSSPGEYAVELIVTDDDDATDTTTVPVEVQPASPPTFDVDVVGTDTATDQREDSVVTGNPLGLVVNVTNTDEYGGTRTLLLAVEEGIDGARIGQAETSVQLGPGESTQRVLSVPTDSFDPAYASLYAATAEITNSDESDLFQGYVLPDEARFSVEIDESNRPITPGDSFRLTATVENEGYVAGSQPVSLNLSGVGGDLTTVDLDARQSKQVTLSVPTAADDAGTHPAQLTSANESVTAPVDVFPTAEQDVDPESLPGSGTASDPYRITNASELQAMEDDLEAHYELTADVDAAGTAGWHGGAGFDPVGDSSFSGGDPFDGSFDGNGHTISGLTIDRPDETYVGLFGYQGYGGGAIGNVTLTEANVTGDESVGSLVGFAQSAVHNAAVSGHLAGHDNAGGLVGFVGYDGSVRRSAANVVVAGIKGEYGGAGDLGGLVGRIGASGEFTGSVSQSYATVTVDGDESVAGLVSRNDGTIDDSYATGTGTGDSQVDGLVRKRYDGDRYSARSGSANESYWDTQATGRDSSAGGTGLTTGQMTGGDAPGNMSGLDFDDTWRTRPGDYPVLAWQSAGALDIPSATVDANASSVATENATVGEATEYTVTVVAENVPSTTGGTVDVRIDGVELASGGDERAIEYDAADVTDGTLTVSESLTATAQATGRYGVVVTALHSDAPAASSDASLIEDAARVDDVDVAAKDAPDQASVSLSPRDVTVGTETDVTVSVTDEQSGARVANASVELPELGLSGTTDDSGTARLSVNATTGGDYAVSATAPGYHDASATLTAQSVNTTSVAVEPVTRTIGVGETAEYRVAASEYGAGIAAYEFEASLDNTTTATITDVQLEGASAGGLGFVDYANDGAGVSAGAALADHDEGVIATITVTGDEPGTSALSLESVSVSDPAGDDYAIDSVTSGTVIVGGETPSSVVGGSPPGDPDDDGTYEDVNGDGHVDIVDVNALFENLDASVVQNHTSKFDFNGDGRVDVVDVNRFFASLTS